MFLTKLKLAAAASLLIMTGSAVLFSQATAQKPVAPDRQTLDTRRRRLRPRIEPPPATTSSMSRCSSAPGPTPSPAATRRSSTGSWPTTSRASTRPATSSPRRPTCPTSATASFASADRARRDQDPPLRRDRRGHQPDQDRGSPDPRSNDERLRQAAGPLAMRGVACQRDRNGSLPRNGFGGTLGVIHPLQELAGRQGCTAGRAGKPAPSVTA